MIPTTLVVGADADARERAIARAVVPGQATAAILEGLPSGKPVLVEHSLLSLARIAAGCPCCEGNLVLRVTLNRILRRKPARLFIGLTSGDHLPGLRAFLSAAPYSDLLALTEEIHAG